jgi:hypothetical protein
LFMEWLFIELFMPPPPPIEFPMLYC